MLSVSAADDGHANAGPGHEERIAGRHRSPAVPLRRQAPICDSATTSLRRSTGPHVMESDHVDLISCMANHAVEIQMLGPRLPSSCASPGGYGGCGRYFPADRTSIPWTSGMYRGSAQDCRAPRRAVPPQARLLLTRLTPLRNAGATRSRPLHDILRTPRHYFGPATHTVATRGRPGAMVIVSSQGTPSIRGDRHLGFPARCHSSLSGESERTGGSFNRERGHRLPFRAPS